MVVFDDYSSIGAKTKSSGLYGFAGINLFNVVNFSASYTNMASGTSEIKVFLFLNLNTENIPKLNSAMAFYQRNNETNPFDFENPSKIPLWAIELVMVKEELA